MNPDVKDILGKVVADTPEYSYWESHRLENALVDEGCYVKSADAQMALKTLAEKIERYYENKLKPRANG
jgi:hypothetical protein